MAPRFEHAAVRVAPPKGARESVRGARMATRKRKRIAVAIFSQTGRLSQALSELSALDLPEYALFLLFGSQKDGLGESFDSVSYAPVLYLPSETVRNKFRWRGAPASTVRERLIDLAGWMEPRMAATLGKHIADGACLLFAIADTPEDEQAICAVLIEYSLDQVQAHDFWL